MIKEGGRIVDLGAGGRKITPNTITVDFIKIGDTDVIADIHFLPFKDKSVDGLFCTGTLEHVEHPEKVVQEIRRVLKNTGIVYIDVPFLQCYHPDPVDYWRFTVKGIELICVRNGLEKIETGVHIGPASALTWMLMAISNMIFSNSTISKYFTTLSSNLVSPLKYLDKLIIKSPNSMVGASAVYFLGSKKPSRTPKK